MNQKLYFSGKYIVCSENDLKNLIQILTGGIVEIEIEPIEVSCLGSPAPYSKILNIWITKDSIRIVFKYDYALYLSAFDEAKITLKYIRS